jgi:hypothetical protein
MHKSQSSFYLTSALHVSGIAITHLQEHKTTVTTASGNRYTILLSAAIMEEFQLFHDSSRQQYGITVTRCCSYSCFVLLKMGDSAFIVHSGIPKACKLLGSQNAL